MKQRTTTFVPGETYRTTKDIDLHPYGIVPCGTHLRVVESLPDWQAVSVNFLQTPAGFLEDGFALQGDELAALAPDPRRLREGRPHLICAALVVAAFLIGWHIPAPAPYEQLICDAYQSIEATIVADWALFAASM